MKYGRELLKNVEGYVPGEQPRDAAYIKLNTNENPYPPSPKVTEALKALPPDALRKYPDPLSGELRAACAERYGYPSADWVIAGNGMDELLALAIRTFVDPGDFVVAPEPTYTLYETLCDLHGATLKYVPLDDVFQLTDDFFAATGRLAILTRPTAPAGVAAPRAAVERFCESFGGLVLIDEAYVDFCDDHCMDFPTRYENAIVMRTFSKSFSLAGMRIGTAVARPEIIREFLKTKDSYNLDAVSQAVALAAMRDYEYMERNAARIKTSRAWLTKELCALGFTVPPSQSNFLLAQWDGKPETRQLFLRLREHHILVRYFDTPRLRNALRITVGTDDECAALVEALGDIIEGGQKR